VLVGLLLVCLALRATADHGRDRRPGENPVGDAIKVSLTGSVDFDAGPYHRNAGSRQTLPLIPLQVSGDWLPIPRISANPLVYQPDVTSPNGGVTGMPDTVAAVFREFSASLHGRAGRFVNRGWSRLLSHILREQGVHVVAGAVSDFVADDACFVQPGDRALRSGHAPQ
jgi:hypothetical protein